VDFRGAELKYNIFCLPKCLGFHQWLVQRRRVTVKPSFIQMLIELFFSLTRQTRTLDIRNISVFISFARLTGWPWRKNSIPAFTCVWSISYSRLQAQFYCNYATVTIYCFVSLGTIRNGYKVWFGYILMSRSHEIWSVRRLGLGIGLGFVIAWHENITHNSASELLQSCQ
jgi:hypothetical protein